jgi:exodeoxyribonuclease V beta subunit
MSDSNAVRYPRPAVLGQLRDGGKPRRLAVIEASAGTGKTFTIEHAVVDLVLVGVPLEEILVVTFTEKATTELRERVRRLLAKVLATTETPPGTGAEAWTLDATARERLRAALLSFDEAAISTIHGFCQRVLTENAFLLGRLLRQELVDPKAAFGSAFKGALRNVYACPPLDHELAGWLESGRNVEQLERLLWDVHGERAEIRPPLDAAALRQAGEDLLACVSDPETLGAIRTSIEGGSLHGSTKKAALGRLDTLEKLGQNWRPPVSILKLHVDKDLKKVLDYLLKRKVSLQVMDLGPECERLIFVLRKLKRSMATYEAAATQLFLPHAHKRLEDAKRKGGLYDYDDMLTQVREGVTGEGPASVALVRRLRARYRHALIDEFQDTDDVQWDVFRRLFLDSPDDHGLWVVGDPKQAIYGFRGGDVFTYLRARNQLGDEGAARVPLQQNFRSTPDVIAGLHHLFDPAAEKPFFANPEIPYDDQVTAGAPVPSLRTSSGDVPTPIKICRLSSAPGDPLYAGTVRSLHGRWIAQEIRRIQDDGLCLERAGKTSPVRLGDIFVLTRTAREGIELAGYLREAGIRHAFYKQSGLFKTREADDVQRLLAAIESPWRRARRVEAWTTPFFGLELSDLPATQDLPSDHPLHSRLQSWHALAERRHYETLFSRILSESGLIRREIFLRESERELTNYLHVFELLLEEIGRERLELRELAQLLRSWIDGQRQPRGEDGDVQRLESDADAVQIMSMHKAKGLEAMCVFLYGGITHRKSDTVFLYHEPPPPNAVRRGPDGKPLSEEESRRAWGREQGRRERDLQESAGEAIFVYHDPHGQRVVHVGLPDGDVLNKIREEREAEQRRLIYVATTRTKGRLYLPAFERTDDGWCYPRLGGCMLQLAERLALLHAAGELPASLFEVDEVSPTAAPPAPPEPDLRGIGTWKPPPEVLDPSDPIADSCQTLRADPAHMARVVTSYSRLKAAQAHNTEVVEVEESAAEEPPDVSELKALPTDTLPGGASMGSFVHEAFENVAFDSLAGDPPPDLEEWGARPDILEIFQRAARHYAIAEEHIPGAQALVWNTLVTPITLPTGELPGGLRSVDSPLPEPEFLYPLPDPGAVAMHLPAEGERLTVERGYARGFIDLLFRHPDDGRAYFLDWKTDRLSGYAPGPDGPLAKRVNDHYGLQLRLYSLALARLLGIDSPEAYEKCFGGAVYAFSRGIKSDLPSGSGIYAVRPTWDELKAWEASLMTQEVRT